MRQILFTLILFCSMAWNAMGQTGQRCTTGINQWVNGTLETNQMACYQFNPWNAFNPAGQPAPFNTINNTAFRTQASTRWQDCQNGPNGSFVMEAHSDHTLGTANGHYIYVDPREDPTGNPWAASVWHVRQSVFVRSGNTYTFSAWVVTMSQRGTAATVELQVNGTTLTGTNTALAMLNCPAVPTVPTRGTWQQISGTWVATLTGWVNADIVGISPVVNGHDFGIDDISFTGELEVNAGEDQTVCFGDEQTLQLGGNPTAQFGAACPGYTYLWSPATGLSSTTASNPFLDISALTVGTHTYTVTATDENGQTCSDEVSIVVNKCCELDIDINRDGCDLFQFEPEKPARLTEVCRYWTLDGDLWNYNGDWTQLEPGTHTICVYMLGYVRAGGKTENCCMERCVTVTIPVAEHDDIQAYYCELENGFEFDGNFYSQCDYYTLEQLPAGLNHDSRILGKIVHHLTEGDYIFKCYDANGCLILSIDIHVHKTLLQETTCYRRLVQCQPPIDPNSVLPNPVDCPDCYDPLSGDVYDIQPFQIVSVDPANGTTKYRKLIYNLTDCKLCTFTFDIVDAACDYTPEFSIFTTTPAPFAYQFTRLSPTSNLCGNITWTIEDMATNTIIHSSTTPTTPNTPLNFTFPGTGTYKICMTTCVCICSTQCCKTRCYLLTVNNQPPFMIIEDPLLKSSEGSKKTFLPPVQSINPNIQLNIVPNPTSSVFRIVPDMRYSDQLLNYDKIVVTDQNGKVVFQKDAFTESDWVNLGDMSSGMYYVTVKYNQKEHHLKLLLE